MIRRPARRREGAMARGRGPADPSVVGVDRGLQLQWQFFQPGVGARDDGCGREGLRLFEEGTGFGSFDAVLAAAAHAAGAEALVSADTGFSGIAAIHHVVPDVDGVRGLLAAAEE
jgi:hypothetical protein